MSTKSSIFYSGYPKPDDLSDIHFFEDLLDERESCVYLVLRGEDIEYSASPGSIRVRIPADVWEVIRQHQHVSFDVEKASDEELLAMAIEHVDNRLKEINEPGISETSKAWRSFAGSMVLGSGTDPREEQIAFALNHYKKRRTHQQAIRAKMAKYQGVQRGE